MIKSLLLLGVLVSSIITGIAVTQKSHNLNTEASTFNTRLSLPASSTVALNQTLSIPVSLNTGKAQIMGADVVIQYDKTKLSLVNIVPVLPLSSYTYLPANSSGSLDISKIVSQSVTNGNTIQLEFSFISTTFSNPHYTAFSTNDLSTPIANLQFTPLSTGTTQVIIGKNSNSTTDSNIAQFDTGLDILDFVDNDTVTILPQPTLTPIPPTATLTPTATITPKPSLTPTLTPSPTLTPTPTPNPTGNLDDATCATIYGWSCDPNFKNVSASVTIKIDGLPLSIVTANQTRTDLNSVCGNTTNHGFSINTPASVYDGLSHTITASSSINGYVKNLTGSKTLRCVTASITPLPSSTPTTKPSATPIPTATSTPRPTSTSTPRPTNTSTPRPTSTSTPRPTSTPIPTSTSTPRPSNTSTPIPTATKTPTPIATTTTQPSTIPTSTLVPTSIPSATPTPAPDNWTRCASENNFCSFAGTARVRYGIFGIYAYGVFTNGVQCSNSVFGDPFIGFVKNCDYQLISTPTPTITPVPTVAPSQPPQATNTPKPSSTTQPTSSPAPTSTPAPTDNWIACGLEREFCSFTGTAEVRYGVFGVYKYGTFTNGVDCNNSVFGDPFWGIRKHCDYRLISSNPSPTNTPTPNNDVYNIFFNSFSDNWQNWSWDTTTQISDIIMATSNTNNAGLYIRSRTALPVSKYKYLKFDLKAKQLPTTIKVFAYGTNANPPLNSGLNISTYGTISTQNFITFLIPLSDINAVGDVYGFSFQIFGSTSSGKTIYLDDIVLSN